MLYLQLRSDQQQDISAKLAADTVSSKFPFTGCSLGPSATLGASEELMESTVT